jgi:hypothetical protein
MSAVPMTAIECDVIDDEGKCRHAYLGRGNPTEVRHIVAAQGWTRRGWADACPDHAEGGVTA